MNPVTWKKPPHPKPFRYEDAAWRELARQFAAPVARDLDTDPTRRGLCQAITYLFWRHRITEDMKRRMTWRVEAYTGSGWAYAYESSYSYNENFIPNREARSLACLWLALDSQIAP